jgi:DNA-binding XRE family transcriptional regulator
MTDDSDKEPDELEDLPERADGSETETNDDDDDDDDDEPAGVEPPSTPIYQEDTKLSSGYAATFSHLKDMVGMAGSISSTVRSIRQLAGITSLSKDMTSAKLLQSLGPTTISMGPTSAELARSLGMGPTAADLARSLGMSRSSLGSTAAEVARSIGVSRIAVGPTAADLARSLGMSRSSLGSTAAEVARSIGVSRIAVGPTAADLARSLGMSRSSLGSTAAEVARSLGVSRIAVGPTAADLARSLGMSRSSLGSTAAEVARSLGVSRIAVGPTAADLARSLGMSRSSLGSTAAEVARSIGVSRIAVGPTAADLARSLGVGGVLAGFSTSTNLAKQVTRLATLVGTLAGQVHLADRALHQQEQASEQTAPVEELAEGQSLHSPIESPSDSSALLISTPRTAEPLIEVPSESPALLVFPADYYSFDEETVPAQAPDSWSRQVALLQAMAEPAYLDFARRALNQSESWLLKWLTPSYYDVAGWVVALTSMGYNPAVVGVVVFLLVRFFSAISFINDRKRQ